MEITFEIPEPKFKVGDVVRVRNKHNNRSHYLKIETFLIEGIWELSEKGVMVEFRKREPKQTEHPWAKQYTAVYMPDSWTDSIEPVLLTGDRDIDMVALDENGELFSHEE